MTDPIAQLSPGELERLIDFAAFFFSESKRRPGRVWSRGVWDVDSDNALYAKLVDALGVESSTETLRALEMSDWELWWMQRGFIGIRMILVSEWDPVGIKAAGESNYDEYDSYIWIISDLLRLGAREALTVCLARIQKETMGLGQANAMRKANDDATVAQLSEWYAEEMKALETRPPPG
jgi:hypothetical protein